MVKASNQLWPRVMRWHTARVQRSVDRGCAGLAIELRNHQSQVVDLVLSCVRLGLWIFHNKKGQFCHWQSGTNNTYHNAIHIQISLNPTKFSDLVIVGHQAIATEVEIARRDPHHHVGTRFETSRHQLGGKLVDQTFFDPVTDQVDVWGKVKICELPALFLTFNTTTKIKTAIPGQPPASGNTPSAITPPSLHLRRNRQLLFQCLWISQRFLTGEILADIGCRLALHR